MRGDAKNVLVYRLHDERLRRLAGRYLRGRLLDIGCGVKPYRELVAPFVTEHVGVDHAGTMHDKGAIDLLGTAYEIPCADGSFDSALSTSVLEHLEEPERALRECYRVLAPGGHAIYSVPFIWHLHEEPRDFYRFSEHGLRYLFEKVGFEVVELVPLSGFWATFATMLSYNLSRLSRGPLKKLRIVDALQLGIQGAAFLLEAVDRSEAWTCLYMIVARKPGGSATRGSSCPGRGGRAGTCRS